ncbi:MAG: hypothetical protein AB2L14_12905 [Candidatus Xenobiia bacterium LiM19]
MVSPLHGKFLAEEFKQALGPDKELASGLLIKGKIAVKQLIVMTIEDLENLETSIKNFRLRDLLADYSSENPDRGRSLFNYIADSYYHDKLCINSTLLKKSKEIYKEACDMLLTSISFIK